MTTDEQNDLERPAGLSDKGNAAYEAIVAFLTKNDLTYTGGCKAFYSPAEWKDRGEEYGLESLLIVCHDGGDLSALCYGNGDHVPLQNAFVGALKAAGLYCQPCTCWYSAIYEIS